MAGLPTLLQQAGAITPRQLDDAKARRRELGASAPTLVELLVRTGAITASRLVQLASRELSVPVVNLARYEPAAELLGLVPADVAIRHGVLPYQLESLRDGRQRLHLVMIDPTDEAVVARLATRTGTEVRRAIADPLETRARVDGCYALTIDVLELDEGVVQLDPASLPPIASVKPKSALSTEAMRAVRASMPAPIAPTPTAAEPAGLTADEARTALLLAMLAGEGVRVAVRAVAPGSPPREIEGVPTAFRASSDGRERVVIQCAGDVQQLVLLERVADVRRG